VLSTVHATEDKADGLGGQVGRGLVGGEFEAVAGGAAEHVHVEDELQVLRGVGGRDDGDVEDAGAREAAQVVFRMAVDQRREGSLVLRAEAEDGEPEKVDKSQSCSIKSKKGTAISSVWPIVSTKDKRATKQKFWLFTH